MIWHIRQCSPLREYAQYHQGICAVKSYFRALATFQIIGKALKQEEAI